MRSKRLFSRHACQGEDVAAAGCPGSIRVRIRMVDRAPGPAARRLLHSGGR
jgi:hypothetical protein